MVSKNRRALKLLVRSRMDFQHLRKNVDNRIGRKADGKWQDIPKRNIRNDDMEMFIKIADEAKDQEKLAEKNLEIILKRFPIYEAWLKHQKGIGAISAGWILADFDIEIASTVSKMWQFAGLNSGMRRGDISVVESKYKPEMGDIVGDLPPTRDKEKRIRVKTNTMIRGDKKVAGFLCPYNANLKTALCGVMADGFIKQQNRFAMEYYYPYKHRLENSESMVDERKKGGKVVNIMWKDCTKGHRDMAAKRYMVKMFLRELYVAWRGIEGLEVRSPYGEEYLGKVHSK